MREKESLPQGYKASSLGIIPQDWNVLRLGDVCSNNGDYGLNAPAIDYSINMPTYLRITDIDENGKFCTGDMKSVDNPMAKNYYLKDGDIVFARTGATVGKTYLYNKKDGRLVYAGFLIKFSPNDKRILPYYLKVYTETKMYWNWVAVVSQRSGQPGINASEYCSFKMIVPPIEEQKKIAEILSEWDKAIELQTKLIEQLEMRKRALMQRLLTGRVRLNGNCGTWRKVKLGTVCGQVVRKNLSNNKTVMTISAQKGFIVQTDFFSKTIASKKLDNYFLVNKDEFCYNKSYSNGYPMGAIKRLKEVNEAVVTTLYICFKLKKEADINIDFFEQYCELGGFNKELTKVANKGGRAHGLLNVTPTDFFNIKLKVPSLTEQIDIVNVLITADKEIESARTKLSALRNQKQGLMQQLLTGKQKVRSIMKYTQTYTDIFLKENIMQRLNELTLDFDNSIANMELCMEQFHIGLKECKKKNLNNTLVLWNYAGFINMCAMELKIYIKSIVSSTNEWEMRTHIKTSYLLVHSFFETYNIIQKDYSGLSYHEEIGNNFTNDLRNITTSLRHFRKLYLNNINIIRNRIIAHLNSDISYHISTMKTFQLSQTIETLLEFGNILNIIGKLLSEEIKFVMSNLDEIK